MSEDRLCRRESYGILQNFFSCVHPMKHGLLIINLGTPDNPSVGAVGRYLREFLADGRVISLPAPLRYLLLYCFILPFRVRRSAHAYQMIWSAEGSPLLHHSRSLVNGLQKRLEGHCKVVLGMRYGNPSIDEALHQLSGCEKITVLPLYPQYSSAATGSSIEKTLRSISTKNILPSLNVIRDFYSHQSFINAQVAMIKSHVGNHDYILFSYHGLPEQHLQQGGCNPVCAAQCPPISSTDKGCYRAQCLQTTALVAESLGLTEQQHGTAFQSRLGKMPWIKPYTDEILVKLISQGIKRIAVVCPSFVADCLETLEEIGIRLKSQWIEIGGTQLTLIPCLNDSEPWLDAIIDITNIRVITPH